MIASYQPLKTFISSPGDVEQERQMAEEVIRKVNDGCKDTLGIFLDVRGWEQLPPLAPNLPNERIQDIIEQQVRECNIFVLILFRRYGSVEPRHKKSNTEREVEIAIEMLQKERKLMFLSYFRNMSRHSRSDPQEKKVQHLRKHLQNKGIWFRSYSRPEEFKDMLTHDLYQTILKFRLSTSKHKALHSFWQLGLSERPTQPRLAIVYPPIDTTFMKIDNPEKYWLKRLVPNIVFEDFKALQKVDKSLRHIGVHQFTIYNTASIPSDIQYMNRVWLCLPRNVRALQQLAIYSNESKFQITPRNIEKEATILWRHSLKNHEYFKIHSPLSKYLTEQRKNMPGGEWRSQLGRIVAKDFAVLARFNDKSAIVNVADDTLRDYFIAGIRGLGTWGAAWFIDRKYDVFRRIPKYENIQLLLEVTYKDERIFDVRNVSEEPESYFRTQNSLNEIRRVIRQYWESK